MLCIVCSFQLILLWVKLINWFLLLSIYKIQVACININGTGPYNDSIKMLSGNESNFL